jgi:phospholipase C
LNPAQAVSVPVTTLSAIRVGPQLTTSSDFNLFQASAGGEIDLIQGGRRRRVPDAATVTFVTAQHGPLWTVGALLQSFAVGDPLPSRADGMLYKGSGTPVYQMSQGERRYIPDAQTFTAMGLNASAVVTIADLDLNDIPRGPDFQSVTLDVSTIQHVVVVMIENRSFDHLLGYLKEQIPALDGITTETQGNFVNQGPRGPVAASATASYSTLVDPGHELCDTNRELHSNANASTFSGVLDNGGFVSTYADKVAGTGFDPGGVMQCFAPASLPALTLLAREYAVCDRWFASLPGPTMPNRMFVHTGTCLAYARSLPSSVQLTTLLGFPQALTIAIAEQAGIQFVFDAIQSAGQNWMTSGLSLLKSGNPVGLLEAAGGLVVDAIGAILKAVEPTTDFYPQVITQLENLIVSSSPDLAYFMGAGDVINYGATAATTWPESIYEKLENVSKKPSDGWRLYFQDFSETFFIPFMRSRLQEELKVDLSHPTSPVPRGVFWNGQTGNFRTFEKFLSDALTGELPRFSFVQPRMEQVFNADDLVTTVRGLFNIAHETPTLSSPVPNDAHPPHDVRDMEAFVVKVYDALRASPAWKNTLLVITADEHGGFYDHVTPPATQNPDGLTYNGEPNSLLHNTTFFHLPEDPDFDFQTLGVRVPGIVISPYLAAGSVNSTVFDHTSIGATLRSLFNLNGSFTARMQNANALTTGQAWVPFRTDTVQGVSRLLPARSPGWASLGGFAVDSPAVARNQDGRLEIFIRAASGEIHHAWEITPGGLWSDWISVATVPNGTAFAGVPSVVTNRNGRLEVFARGEDDTLYHAVAVTPNALGAGAWGYFAPLATGLLGDPLVVTNGDGRQEIFYSTPNGLAHVWQNTPGDDWQAESRFNDKGSPPTSIGGGVTSSGQMVLFGAWPPLSSALHPDQTPNIQVRWQQPGLTGGWTEWADMEAENGGQDPQVLLMPDGRLAVFALAYNATILYERQKNPGAISAPVSFDVAGAIPDTSFVGYTAALNSSGWVEIIAFDASGQLWQIEQVMFGTLGGMAWSRWQLLGGPFSGTPVLTLGNDGRMSAFVIGFDNNIWVRRQTAPGVW